MNTHNYQPGYQIEWKGRVDSTSNYDAFRWHQWIKPLDISKEKANLKPNEVGFCLIGFCCDLGVVRNQGRTGAALGPNVIRKELSNLPCSFTEYLKLFDAGNILSDNRTLEESQEHLADAVHCILGQGLFPIVLGGGHETAYGHYLGLERYMQENQEKKKLGIVNFDAHFDLRPYPNGGSSGTMFRQIADRCLDLNQHFGYCCIGVQRRGNTVELFKTANRLGTETILAKDIIDHDLWTIIERLDGFINQQDALYLTICADVFSTAFAPGVSAPQALGLEPEKVLKLIKYMIRSQKLISFDIAEVSPRFDQDSSTASLASTIIFSLVNTFAELKGISYNI